MSFSVDDPTPTRPRISRRALLGGGLVATAGTSALAWHAVTNDLGGLTTRIPQASCAPVETLAAHGSIGRARLVYEIDHQARSFRFEPTFHRQLVQWLADWEATSPHRGVSHLWTYGAHVAKDGCRSWHAAGRALDFSRLRGPSGLLVSCRTDLWHEVDTARRTELERRYWGLAASLNLHFSYVLTHHFDAAHANHIHVDNGVSGDGLSRFVRASRTQNQCVQAICRSLWGRDGEVTGDWADTRRMLGPVLDDLSVTDLRRQETWQVFLRASVDRI